VAGRLPVARIFVLVATNFCKASKRAWAFCLELARGGLSLAVAHVIEGALEPGADPFIHPA
jgi:hypothetical protein